MSGEVWLTPYWSGCEKHFSPPGNTEWADIVAGTNKGRKVAKYHKSLSPGQIEAIEMSFEEDGEFLVERWPKRYYYIRRNGLVGASKGQETEIVKIERHQSGPVHGYPITEEELQRFLRKYQP